VACVHMACLKKSTNCGYITDHCLGTTHERACTPFKIKRAYGKHLYLPVLLVNQEAPILAGTMKVSSI
jgi:hypothetical protein